MLVASQLENPWLEKAMHALAGSILCCNDVLGIPSEVHLCFVYMCTPTVLL